MAAQGGHGPTHLHFFGGLLPGYVPMRGHAHAYKRSKEHDFLVTRGHTCEDRAQVEPEAAGTLATWLAVLSADAGVRV